MVLNLNWEIIWVFVNLLILFLLMKKFLFGPITKLLDERAKGVADTLDQAETQLAERSGRMRSIPSSWQVPGERRPILWKKRGNGGLGVQPTHG